MKPRELLGTARTPDGTEITLYRRDKDYMILANGLELMSSRMKGSEQAMATIACDRAQTLAAPCVLVGGLGMGFTLRATLDLMPPGATVVVSELLAAVVEWNRGPLGPLAPLADHVLDDSRVTVDVGDVGALLRKSKSRFDVILLDVDNGPAAFSQASNAGLYGNAGVGAARAALRPGGVLAVWSAGEDRRFENRLRDHGFDVNVHHVRARLEKGGPKHTIFVGRT